MVRKAARQRPVLRTPAPVQVTIVTANQNAIQVYTGRKGRGRPIPYPVTRPGAHSNRSVAVARGRRVGTDKLQGVT